MFVFTYLVHKWWRALREDHVWLSVFIPPLEQRLVVTRPQRVVILCVSILGNFAVAAAMFYALPQSLSQVFVAAIINNAFMIPFEEVLPRMFEAANTYQSITLKWREKAREKLLKRKKRWRKSRWDRLVDAVLTRCCRCCLRAPGKSLSTAASTKQSSPSASVPTSPAEMVDATGNRVPSRTTSDFVKTKRVESILLMMTPKTVGTMMRPTGLEHVEPDHERKVYESRFVQDAASAFVTRQKPGRHSPPGTRNSRGLPGMPYEITDIEEDDDDDVLLSPSTVRAQAPSVAHTPASHEREEPLLQGNTGDASVSTKAGRITWADPARRSPQQGVVNPIAFDVHEAPGHTPVSLQSAKVQPLDNFVQVGPADDGHADHDSENVTPALPESDMASRMSDVMKWAALSVLVFLQGIVGLLICVVALYLFSSRDITAALNWVLLIAGVVMFAVSMFAFALVMNLERALPILILVCGILIEVGVVVSLFLLQTFTNSMSGAAIIVGVHVIGICTAGVLVVWVSVTKRQAFNRKMANVMQVRKLNKYLYTTSTLTSVTQTVAASRVIVGSIRCVHHACRILSVGGITCWAALFL